MPDLRHRLTPRERELANLMHISTKRLAWQFGLSPVTVNNHLSHVVAKLRARNRIEAALRFHGVL